LTALPIVCISEQLRSVVYYSSYSFHKIPIYLTYQVPFLWVLIIPTSRGDGLFRGLVGDGLAMNLQDTESSEGIY